MRIEFLAHDCRVSQLLKDHAEHKLAKLGRVVGDQATAHVSFTIDRHRYMVEIVLAHRHGTLHARTEGPDLRAALTAAADQVIEQARRGRKKHQQNRRRAQRARPQAGARDQESSPG